MTRIHQFAPAKLNLYLHVTGRRVDGFHNLDSLVAFATIGDELTLTPSSEFRFELEGPQAAILNAEEAATNLVVAAAESLAELTGNPLNATLKLEKHLPIASGIGGGSSDAAAALRALSMFWGMDPYDPRILAAALRHGQDVPLCLQPSNMYMTADGVISCPSLPRVPVVLINPNKGLSTPSVFKEYKRNGDEFSLSSQLNAVPQTISDLVAALELRHNDLFAPACRLMPEIANIIEALHADERCLLARMSGSGATCFGLYATDSDAREVANHLSKQYKNWWVASGSINDLD